MADFSKPSLYQLLWAKADHNSGNIHPLFCHMIDVAQVAIALWRRVLTTSIRDQLAGALGLEADAAGLLLSFWAGLHDMGKASPSFQRRLEWAKSRLSAAGLPFPKVYAQAPRRHATVSASVLCEILKVETGLPARLARRIAQALGGHHGTWPSAADIQHVGDQDLGGSEWDAIRKDLILALKETLKPPSLTWWQSPTLVENGFLVLFSGLVATADWIGSMEDYFPFCEAPIVPDRYAEQAAKSAHRALEELGWTDWQAPVEFRSFEKLFLFAPNSMQRSVVELVQRLQEPALVLIEAPTGCGKTEAALYTADALTMLLEQRGFYVAMPTVTTSNQIYERVKVYLRYRYNQVGHVEPLLVHGQARWVDAPPSLSSEDEYSGSSGRTMAWFLPRKRSLLAPLGVGTVDQSLLAVLQTRHFFVRLFGLSHKTIIFDEIHAYDTYMSTLFQRLLSWLKTVGTSVVLLSATLPDKTRRELVQAYAGPHAELPAATYPAITWATQSACGVVPLTTTNTTALFYPITYNDREGRIFAIS